MDLDVRTKPRRKRDAVAANERMLDVLLLLATLFLSGDVSVPLLFMLGFHARARRDAAAVAVAVVTETDRP